MLIVEGTLNKLQACINIGLLFLLLVSSCSQTGAGPRTWIDQPLDNSTFPLQMIILQAHASDDDGVDTIEFFHGDQPIKKIDAMGKRLGQAMYEWMPPGEGMYTIYAQSTDTIGNPGMAASSVIIISNQVVMQELPLELEGSVIGQEIEDKEEEEELIQVAEEPIEVPSVVPEQAINCRSGPSTDFEIDEVLQNGQAAEVIDRLGNNSWYLILHPENFVECWVAANIVDTIGDFGNVPIAQSPQLPESPPPFIPEEEPEPETDTSPPTITYVQVSPSTIYQNGCSGFTQTAIISVKVIDLGGISTVQAVASIGSESSTVILSHVGGNEYQGVIGPFSTKGTVNIHGSALDNSNNWTPFITTLVVDCCVC